VRRGIHAAHGADGSGCEPGCGRLAQCAAPAAAVAVTPGAATLKLLAFTLLPRTPPSCHHRTAPTDCCPPCPSALPCLQMWMVSCT
jgi:hypothetical protein